jgi:hypothetical protein
VDLRKECIGEDCPDPHLTTDCPGKDSPEGKSEGQSVLERTQMTEGLWRDDIGEDSTDEDLRTDNIREEDSPDG